METTIALVGNPNSGKTTLFNQLTGNHQYVGNWPGVTVERKTGHLKSDKNIQFVDLPGIYSLSPYSSEEVISRNYLVDGNPDVIINIVDASNLERNLYLTTQLMEFGIPVVVALNLMDIVKKHGYTIKSKELSEQLQVPVVEISALRGDGLEDLVATTVKAAHAGIAPQPVTLRARARRRRLPPSRTSFRASCPADMRRYYAIKLFERDQKAIDELGAKVSCDDIILEAESALRRFLRRHHHQRALPLHRGLHQARAQARPHRCDRFREDRQRAHQPHSGAAHLRRGHRSHLLHLHQHGRYLCDRLGQRWRLRRWLVPRSGGNRVSRGHGAVCPRCRDRAL